MKTPVLESLFNKFLLKGNPVNIAKFLKIPILKNTCQWLLLYEDAKILEKYLLLGIWMFLPTLLETEYIWIFSFFKAGIFIVRKVLHYLFNFQKQSLADLLQNRRSWKFRKLHSKTLKSKSFFNKVAGLKACVPAALLKRDSETGVFLWNLQNI